MRSFFGPFTKTSKGVKTLKKFITIVVYIWEEINKVYFQFDLAYRNEVRNLQYFADIKLADNKRLGKH